MSINVQRMRTEGFHDNIDDAQSEITGVLQEHFAHAIEFALKRAASEADDILKASDVDPGVRRDVANAIVNVGGLTR